ncbi:hypothetical protein evm_009290 [Chilo suppressalis]|nr:hypothetical protein evm_009290 [Chilo suppressalis]
MRALPALLALAATVAVAASAASAAATTPTQEPAAEPALLVLRAACIANDPSAFDETRLRLHAASTGRAHVLHNRFQILSYEETCGSKWRSSVMRAMVSSLGGGAPVLVAGWAEGSVCDALEAAARALRAGQAGGAGGAGGAEGAGGAGRVRACAGSRLRAASVAWLAERLRWRRVLLLAAPDHSECAAALRDVRRSLAAAGVSVRTGKISTDELSNHPQAVVTCASLRGAGTAAGPRGAWGPGDGWGAGGARPTLLLLHVDEPPQAFTQSNITLHVGTLPYQTNLSRVPSTARPANSNLSLFYPKSYKKSFPTPLPTFSSVNNVAAPYRNKRARYRVEMSPSMTSKPVFRGENNVNTIKTDTVSDPMRGDSYLMYKLGKRKQPSTAKESKDEFSQRTKREAIIEGISSPELKALEVLASQLDDTLQHRILFLSQRRLEVPHPSRSLVQEAYDEILDAVQQSVEKTGTYTKASKAFSLYERVHKANSAGTGWSRIAILTATSKPDEDMEEWSAIVEVTNSTHSFERLSEEREEVAGSGVSVPVLVWSIGLAAAGAVALALGSRWAATRRRRRRRRGDAVLTAAEFSFPADELRRVGEGMETMLSCWLQQLHEFGGPELERPDLLKQPPRPAPAPSAPSSTCSINRVALDRRTRYKGDAVFMKYLPSASALELKRKATDVVLVLQSLRHENLNPFIG